MTTSSEIQIGRTVTISRKIETVLDQELGAAGRGLHEKLNSVQHLLPEYLVKQMRYIATVRNQLMHEARTLSQADFEQFIATAERAATTIAEIAAAHRVRPPSPAAAAKTSSTIAWCIKIFVGLALGIAFGIYQHEPSARTAAPAVATQQAQVEEISPPASEPAPSSPTRLASAPKQPPPPEAGHETAPQLAPEPALESAADAAKFRAASRLAQGQILGQAVLFNLTLKGADQAVLMQAIANIAGAPISSVQGQPTYNAVDIGLPCIKSLNATFYQDRFVQLSYKSDLPGSRNSGICGGEDGAKLRKMLVSKYGAPKEMEATAFEKPYISDGKYTWRFADGVRMVFEKISYKDVQLRFDDPAQTSAMQQAADRADRQDTDIRTSKQKDVF